MMTASPEGRRSNDTVAAFLADFAAILKRNDVSLRDAEQRSGWSRSTISRAINGDALPKLDLIVDVLTAAGVADSTLADWKARHAELAKAQPNPAAGDAQVAALPAPQRDNPPHHVKTRRRLVLGGIAIALVASAIATLATLLIARQPASPTGGGSPVTPAVARPMAVEVQNKVALGASDLREDSTPAYLSSRTVASCARHGCKVDGTEVTSGALLVATCQTVGTQLVNFNLDSSEATKNPHSVRSALWYRVSLHDGRTGYISEVYILPRDRGGLGLRTC